MEIYKLVEQEVNQRIEWAKDWQSKRANHFAAANINAAYGVVTSFEKQIIDMNSARERIWAWEFADSIRLKLRKAIDEIAQIN